MTTLSRLHVLRALCAVLLTSVIVLTPVAAQRTAGTAKGFMWKVERDRRVGWLIGSLHMLTRDYYPLPPSMEDAFKRSDVLVEEADLDELSSPRVVAALMSKALYPNGQTLDTQVSSETYRLIAGRLARAGLPVEAFRRMKPWMVLLTLATTEMTRAGFDPALGLDKHFRDEATAAGKTFQPLESALEQIDMLEQLGPSLQESFVRTSLDELDSELAQVKKMADAWRIGDASAVEHLLLDSMKASPDAYQLLIVNRNRRWMPKLQGCFSTSSCFVVVGAAHLIGPDGIVSVLRQQGYAVEQQ